MPGLLIEEQHTRPLDRDNGEQLHVVQFQDSYYGKLVYRHLVNGLSWSQCPLPSWKGKYITYTLTVGLYTKASQCCYPAGPETIGMYRNTL